MAYFDYLNDDPGDPNQQIPGGGPPPDVPNAGDPFLDQLNALYQKYYGRNATPEELASHRGNPGGLSAIEAALKGSQAPTMVGDPTTPPPPTTKTGTGAGSLGDLIFRPPAPTTGPPSWWTPPPDFKAPTFTPPPAFVDPTQAEARADPGYDFAQSEGQRALEQSKAAQGVYNTGGTLKDILAWGQGFADQRYGDVRNRKKDTYLTNYETQFRQPYEYAYRSALDSFNPSFQGWNTQVAATQRGDEIDWNRAFDVFKDRADRVTNYFTA